MMDFMRYGGMVSALALALPVSLAAQERAVVAEVACAAGAPVITNLGYSGLSCNCTHYSNPEHPESTRWEFRSEPTIQGVQLGGPADGKLRTGDMIIAIDDVLITTREGGRRFSQLEPGAPVRLRVRRDGREVTVVITPGEECLEDGLAVAVAPEVAVEGYRVAVRLRPDTAVAPVVPPARVRVRPTPAPDVSLPPLAPAAMMPRGWLGVSLTCTRCSIDIQEGHVRPLWRFSEPPSIESVERGSPAFRAGIRNGDVITHVDDVDITTEAGGRRFSEVQPGQRVQLRYERGGRPRTATVVVGERHAEAPPPRPAPHADVVVTPQLDVQRFTGILGDAVIEVTGGPITVTRTETEVVIQSRDITVRIKRTEGGR